MPLERGEPLGYDFDRMVYKFTLINQDNTVPFAISSAAMDDMEGAAHVTPQQRDEQFARLRNVIEERAARKFFANPPEALGKEILLRTEDCS